MANSYSDSLFELIKSLTKSEKRYFKLYSSRHTIGEKNNSITLFDFIGKMIFYEEELIFIQFKGQSFLNKFSITKNRLYHQILSSLDSFHSQNSTEHELNRCLHQIDILFNKGLYLQSKKLIESAKKKALKYNHTSILYALIEKEKKHIEKHAYSTKSVDDINNLIEVEKNILHQLKIKSELWHIKGLLFKTINNSGQLRSLEGKNKLEKIISPLKKIDLIDINFDNAYLYHHIKSAFFYSTNKIKESLISLKAVLELFEDNPIMINANPNNYFSVISNYIYVCTKLKLYTEADKYLKLIISSKAQFTTSKDLEIKYFSIRYSLELSLLIENLTFNNCDKLIAEIEEGLNLYQNKITGTRRAYLSFQISILLFTKEKYHDALIWLNRITNDTSLSQKEDIYCFTQIVQLIIHFELKNYRFLPYIIASTKRFLDKRQRMFKFEEVFFKLINKLKSDQLNEFDIEEVFKSLSIEIEALKNDEFEKTVFDYFDFSAWLNSKILKKPFLEVKQAG